MMNHDEKSPLAAMESRGQGLHPPDSTVVESPGGPVPFDRLYRLAAMTAGIFLLATLL